MTVGEKIRTVRLATQPDLNDEVPHPMRRYVAVHLDVMHGWGVVDRLTDRTLLRRELEAMPVDSLIQDFGTA